MSSRSTLRGACLSGTVLSGTVLCGMLLGCTVEQSPNTQTDDPNVTTLKTRDVPVRAVAWNPDKTDLGKVSAVAESDDTTVVFNGAGAMIFHSGFADGVDANVVGTKSAAVIPAADHKSMWVAAVDGKGKVWRLHATASFEVVSNLYGLLDDPVNAIAPFGELGTTFTLDKQLAISDGTNVSRYDTGALSAVSSSDERVAGVTPEGVSVLDPKKGELTKFPLKEASAVAFDDSGRLLALTPDTLYREDSGGELVPIHTSDKKDLFGLTGVPGKVWFTEGTRLGFIDSTGVGLSPEGSVTAKASLTGSETGDVWVLAEGALSRLAADLGDEADRAAWEKDIQPIFRNNCVPCHLPKGTANVVLATYDTWVERRAKIHERVNEKMDMPPTGFELSAEDRATIGAWLTSKK